MSNTSRDHVLQHVLYRRTNEAFSSKNEHCTYGPQIPILAASKGQQGIAVYFRINLLLTSDYHANKFRSALDKGGGTMIGLETPLKGEGPFTLLIRSSHTSATLCGGCVVGCGQSVVASHTWPAPWLQGPATKLWHHNLTTKPATFLVGLWCNCGGCAGQLCGGVVVGLWAHTPPHPPHTIGTPASVRPPCNALCNKSISTTIFTAGFCFVVVVVL